MCNTYEIIILNILSIYIVATAVFLGVNITTECDVADIYKFKATWFIAAVFTSLIWPIVYARNALNMSRLLRPERLAKKKFDEHRR